ncbi:M3 family metallopeptidase [Chachezhania antarctica]|uniref:M3 family metallopeptidase n=1 Tax=Chachezhania antarctica TaxID=2340860 RepID=UPI000EB2B4BF|nr:M3 family metallopeptidase [Chachezhania antarctica]
MTNPLLAPFDTKFGLAPFDAISDEDFTPALDTALIEHKAEIAAIRDQAAAPDFANTVEALEAAGEDLHRVLSVFYTLAGADSSPRREELQRSFAPKVASHYAELTGDKALYARIKAIWEARDRLDLTAEQQRLLYLTHRSFVRAGAALDGEQDARMKAIKMRLAELGTSFTQNLLGDERDWALDLEPEDLEGLPGFLVRAATDAGEERGRPGPVITLSRSLCVPFMETSPRRDLREKVWRAFTARGAHDGPRDNREIAAEILSLRKERAQLLGYDDFASYKLETEMAGTPGKVRDLLMAVWEPAKARAEADAAAMEEMLHDDGVNGPFEPWDWRYYAQKRRSAAFDLDESDLKPYLQLDRLIEAAFDCANRLFGLEFTAVDLPLYHPDARAWEVTRDGQHVALFIGDYFARGSKRSGAWCSAMQQQARFPEAQAPIVINVCNFAKGNPALLSWDEARTLFHEFGHALHQMLSDVTYESMSGTSVARDFVELPSQLYEHWLDVPEVLSRFATHAETGEPMPPEMVEKVVAAANFDMGFQTVEYVASALVDLSFHEGEPPADPMAKQAEILDGIGMPRAIAMRHATPQFAHVFSGDGYSSGYYSYMWSEVMDADAFAAFEEAGGAFDPERAKALEASILSRGGSEEAEALYVEFRGRMPGVEALLKGRGLAA